MSKTDKHIIPSDDSTTVMERATGGCCGGHHQTIAGALLRSEEWKAWYDYASKNMLFDVAETTELGCMSTRHFNAFINFTISQNKS